MTDLAPLRAGDADAWQALLDPLIPRLRRFVARRVGPDLVDGVISDILAETWEHLPTYQDRGYPIAAWIWRIAHNRSIDAGRMLRRRWQRELDDPNSMHLTTDLRLDEVLAQRADRAAVWRLVDRLPPRHAAILHLRFRHDLQLNEIAQRTGLSLGSVKALQYRALERLRRAQLDPDALETAELPAPAQPREPSRLRGAARGPKAAAYWRAITQRPEISLTALAESFGVNKATAWEHMQRLIAAGVIERAGESGYRVLVPYEEP